MVPSSGRALARRLRLPSSRGFSATASNAPSLSRFPQKKGLYDPEREVDSCGVGMVAHIKGAKSHDIVTQALEILANLDHRGAVGADPLLGDGAGILLQVPDPLFRKWADEHGHYLPQAGDYAVAMCFLPAQDEARDFVEKQLERFAEKEGQRVVGWRTQCGCAAHVDAHREAFTTVLRA